MQAAAQQWTDSYSSKGKAPIWEHIAVNLAAEGLSAEVRANESSVVAASLERSQPVSPSWSSVMLGSYASGIAELKIFLCGVRGMSWQILIPMEWFNYQKDIMESGALGGAGGGAGDENPLDTANGDHQGF